MNIEHIWQLFAHKKSKGCQLTHVDQDFVVYGRFINRPSKARNRHSLLKSSSTIFIVSRLPGQSAPLVLVVSHAHASHVMGHGPGYHNGAHLLCRPTQWGPTSSFLCFAVTVLCLDCGCRPLASVQDLRVWYRENYLSYPFHIWGDYTLGQYHELVTFNEFIFKVIGAKICDNCAFFPLWTQKHKNYHGNLFQFYIYMIP